MPGKPITAQVRQAEGVTISGRMAYRARDTIIEATSVGYESGFTYLEPHRSSFCSKMLRRVTPVFRLMIKAASLEHVLRVLSLTPTIAASGKSLGLMDRF